MAAEMGRMPSFYSQDGRLLQVDYALQAVSRGSTTVGLRTAEFVVLSSQVRPTHALMEPAEKVFTIDEHAGATGSGYIGDVMTLVDELRVLAQRHRLVYDEPPDIGTLSRHLAKFLHGHTLYMVRPFGASLLLGGSDPLGTQLIQVDPSGTPFRGNGFAIGQHAEEALEVLKRDYRADLPLDDAVALAARAITEPNGGAAPIEHGVVRRNSRRFERLPRPAA